MSTATMIEVAAYRVPDDEFEANQKKPMGGGKLRDDDCFLCGRGMSEKAMENGWWVNLAEQGWCLAPMDWEFESPGDNNHDLGWFPIGPECAKKVPLTHRKRGL